MLKINWTNSLTNLKDEFKGGSFWRSLTAGLVIGLFTVMTAVSFAALIYTGDLGAYISQGIGFLLMQNMVIILFVALFSSFAGFIAIGQDSPAAILSLTVIFTLALMSNTAPAHSKFSTVVAMVIITTVSSGLFLLLLGRFKLGGLVRFLPYPVVGGYLAGTGWMLLMGGLRLMADASTGIELLQLNKLMLWLPGLIYSILLFYIMARSDHPAVMPLMLLGGVGIFYMGVLVSDAPLSSLGESGLLLGPFPESWLWSFPLAEISFNQIDWVAIIRSAVVASPILVVVVMSLLLNASGMELVSRRDIDLNRELTTAGWGNLVTGLMGGIPAYQTVSLSSLNFRLSGGRRLSALIAAMVCGAMLVFGAVILVYVPRILVGAILAYLGIALLFEWVYRTWFKFPLVEYLIVILILGVIAIFGFLPGVAVGVITSIILFVVSYSRTDVVKHSLSGLNYSSRVTRSPDQQEVLSQQGERLYILQLQGFIFFGTANKLLERVRKRIAKLDTNAICFVLLDFRQVTGLDSTAILSFQKLKQFVSSNNVTLVMTGLSASTREQFTKSNFLDESRSIKEFSSLDKGLEWCEEVVLKNAGVEEKEKDLSDYLSALLPKPESIPDLLSAMHKKEIEDGYILIQQGDESDKLFFVEKGQVTAQLAQDGGDPIRLETMRGGHMVGEIGFYLGTERTASVLADESSTIYVFSNEDLEELEAKDPRTASAFHRIAAQLLSQRVVHLIKTVEALQR